MSDELREFAEKSRLVLQQARGLFRPQPQALVVIAVEDMDSWARINDDLVAFGIHVSGAIRLGGNAISFEREPEPLSEETPIVMVHILQHVLSDGMGVLACDLLDLGRVEAYLNTRDMPHLSEAFLLPDSGPTLSMRRLMLLRELEDLSDSVGRNAPKARLLDHVEAMTRLILPGPPRSGRQAVREPSDWQ